jgi:hypothetical protein
MEALEKALAIRIEVLVEKTWERCFRRGWHIRDGRPMMVA